MGSNGRVRVTDTSIFPSEIRGHPIATAMAVEMKAAAMMADGYSGAMSSMVETTNGKWGTDNGNGGSEGTSTATNGHDCAFAVAATAAATTYVFAFAAMGA